MGPQSPPDETRTYTDSSRRRHGVEPVLVAVMDGDWRQEVRTVVIERVLAAPADACDMSKPSPTWWVDFRVIDEGSWGSSGGVLSVLSLLDSGVFTDEKVKAIRTALGA
ncbi:hypothetical protein ACH4VX_30845 [Streptomyces sp. NPDC020731]|uniref:hypothetical protein n=1 Tax=Streptomyces sp. NPDC020731 TaxID=3365085 RepID=UPI003787BA64